MGRGEGRGRGGEGRGGREGTGGKERRREKGSRREGIAVEKNPYFKAWLSEVTVTKSSG